MLWNKDQISRIMMKDFWRTRIMIEDIQDRKSNSGRSDFPINIIQKNLCFVTFCYGRTGQKMNKLFNVNSPDLVVFHYALMVLWKITFLSPHHLFSCEMTAWKWNRKREISERFCSISFWLDTLSRATYCILNPREMDGNMDGNKNNYSKKSCVGSIDQKNNKQ